MPLLNDATARRLSALTMWSLLLLLAAPFAARAQAPTYPFFDDVEDTAGSQARWTANDAELAAITEVGAGTAHSGVNVWEITSGGEITTSASVDLSGAENPYVSFWARRTSNRGGTAYLYVSTDDGASWTQVRREGLGDSWERVQVSLAEYRLPNVRLRFTQGGYGIHLDDILFDDAPFPQAVQLSDAGDHEVTVNWSESTADDFGAYRVVLATQTNYLAYNYSGEAGNNWVWDDGQRITFEIADKSKLDTTLTNLYFFGRTYYARVYERDTQGLINAGTDVTEITTAFNVATETAPFTQDFEGGDEEHGWAVEGPWAVTEADAGDAGHSATHAMEDSPGGLYRGNKYKRLVVKVDFTGVQRPMLRFNHRFQFADDVDHGEVFLASESQVTARDNGTRLARFQGTSLGWQSEEIDLGNVNALAESQTAFLIFWINTNGDKNYDGWHLDDVQVLENTYTASYPFFDDAEDAAATGARWIEQTSALREVGEGPAHSGTRVWSVGGYDNLTLGGSVDLSGAENPYVSFWARRTSNRGGTAYLYVSTDDGASWTQVRREGLGDSWERVQVSLAEYRLPNVRLRFTQGGYGIHLDDILFSGDFPANAVSVSPGDVRFEPVDVNTSDTASVVLFNPGTETLSGIVSYAGDDAFSVTAGAGGFSLAANEQKTIRVAFAPAADESFSGTLSFAHNGENEPSPLEVSVRGRTVGAITCLPVALDAGWNIVAPPLRAEAMDPASLFPNTTSHFAYGDGYEPADQMQTGRGYWLQSEGEQSAEVCGDPVSVQEVQVSEGWNLIGPFDTEVATSAVTTDGTATLASDFFGYAGSYQTATTLEPGRGYWVKSDAAGALSFAAPAGKRGGVVASTAPDSSWLRFEVTDAAGRHGALYLAPAGAEGQFVMPPRPPEGAFDLRFGTDRWAEAEGKPHAIRLQGATYPVTLRAANLGADRTARLRDALGAGLFEGALREGEALVLREAVGQLTLDVATTLPDEYALHGNYPNPFRSRTTIGYSLPEAARVAVTVYDVLGRQVAQLAHEEHEAGRHEVAFDGEHFSAGVYFVHIRAGAFQATRKMTLVR